MSNRVRVKFSPDGSLPDGVVLASIHEKRRDRGWYCITPGDVAHGPYSWDQALHHFADVLLSELDSKSEVACQCECHRPERHMWHVVACCDGCPT